ncbi:MAG: ABC transporter ATP-binding protein [Candidatus Methanomethyliaceae archaeon]|nr:ABC transporter ATP-binding protein [Candidatus Methanomethyliaceae archaeon]
MTKAVEISSLSKDFGSVKALNNFSLGVDEGQVYGLLGPNGSGKSTLMKIMVGLLRPTSGSLRVYGNDPQTDPIAVRRMAGYVPEMPRLYDFLTGREYLDFVADLYGVPLDVKRERIEHFLEAFELKGREDEMISGYSQGMRQKVVIIGALLHKPRLLIMDEPLNGLDPRSAKIVKDLLHELSREGVTTIFSTHILEIAQAICERVAIMYRGALLSEGKVEDLKTAAGMPGSSLEDVFLKLTGTDDVRAVVEELVK